MVSKAIGKFVDQVAKDKLLIAALMEWVSNCEGSPNDPNDAELLKAIWRYKGDRLEPCPECDGDCGEPCAPTTAEVACRGLDRWIVDYNKRNGLGVEP